MKKLKNIQRHTKVYMKVYKGSDKRKAKRDAYFQYSATWKAFMKHRASMKGRK